MSLLIGFLDGSERSEERKCGLSEAGRFFASLARGPSFEQEGSEAGFGSSCLEQ